MTTTFLLANLIAIIIILTSVFFVFKFKKYGYTYLAGLSLVFLVYSFASGITFSNTQNSVIMNYNSDEIIIHIKHDRLSFNGKTLDMIPNENFTLDELTKKINNELNGNIETYDGYSTIFLSNTSLNIYQLDNHNFRLEMCSKGSFINDSQTVDVNFPCHIAYTHNQTTNNVFTETEFLALQEYYFKFENVIINTDSILFNITQYGNDYLVQITLIEGITVILIEDK